MARRPDDAAVPAGAKLRLVDGPGDLAGDAPGAPLPPRGRGAEVQRLFARAHGGDARARDELTARFLPLAQKLARRYRARGEPLEDLVQVASLGLVKAIDRFDPGRGVSFSSYAVPAILGELRRHFRDYGWAVHVPRGAQERVGKVNIAVQELTRELGRAPTPNETGATLDLSAEQVLESLETSAGYAASSLDAPRLVGDEESTSYADTVGALESGYELVEWDAAIAPTLQVMPERDRLVLHLRFVEDLTQSQIADRIGVSQMHVSRLIRRSLDRLQVVAEAS